MPPVVNFNNHLALSADAFGVWHKRCLLFSATGWKFTKIREILVTFRCFYEAFIYHQPLMISALKTTFRHKNLKVLRLKVTKILRFCLKNFCEFQPRSSKDGEPFEKHLPTKQSV